MDIKQALNAQAVITLGKDMTFRDYAQGAFRMRGIGVGQTLKVYMIPEVKKRIIGELAAANGATAEEQKRIAQADAQAMSQQVSLTDICTWLVINSMKTEKTQFNMLVEVRRPTTDDERGSNDVTSRAQGDSHFCLMCLLSSVSSCLLFLSLLASNAWRTFGASTR